MGEPAPRLEVHRYEAIAKDAALATRLGLTPAQRTSLLAHPLVKPTDPAVLALVKGEETVARIGLFPGRIQIGGRPYPNMWGTAWSVAPNANIGGAAGILLLRAAREAGSFGGWGISQVAAPIYQAAKFDFTTLERRMLVLHSKPVLRQKLKVDALARVAAVPADLGLQLAHRLLSLRLARGPYEVEQVVRFDAGVDALDRESRPPEWFPRDHVELNWALAHPWLGEEQRHRYVACVLRHRASRELAGYAIARSRFYESASSSGYRDLTLGSILRLVASPRARGAHEALFAGMVELLEAQHVDAIETCTRDPWLLELTKRIGMLHVGEMRVGIKLAGEAAKALRASGRTLADFSSDLGEGDAIFS